jgi:hypothetical protein
MVMVCLSSLLSRRFSEKNKENDKPRCIRCVSNKMISYDLVKNF